MKPKCLANRHHGIKSTESVISGLTMPSSLLHTARTTRPPVSIYAEKTFESNLLKLLEKRSKNDITSGDIASQLRHVNQSQAVVEINPNRHRKR